MAAYNPPPPLAPPMAYGTPIVDNGDAPSYPPSSLLQKNKSHYNLPQGGKDTHVNEQQIKQLLDQGFTQGLAMSLSDNHHMYPLRIWVVDNSGSMQKTDGHRFVETAKKNDVKIVPCSRWDEIRECVTYHVQMAALLEASTSFRMLNDPAVGPNSQQFGVAEGSTNMIPQDVENAMGIMRRSRPGGVTPLTKHIHEIHEAVREMTPQLSAEGQRVVIVLATDGLPTDEQGYNTQYVKDQFVQSLRLLEGLPVWVVIRLCTDEEDVVGFYSDLDEQLELSLEVLDDFVGEAEEVHEHNSWLNYALPLHRLREMGFHDRVFDLIDERALTRDELRDFCVLLFGQDQFDSVPDPAGDWKGFLKAIDAMLKREKGQWNPIKKKVTPWLDLKKLHKHYGDGSACSIM